MGINFPHYVGVIDPVMRQLQKKHETHGFCSVIETWISQARV